MFGSSTRAALIALCLSAAASAAPGLTLKVSGPSDARGVDNLKVVTTLVNSGTESLKLLNDPRGALSSKPTNTFSITDESGASPKFSGIKVKYVPKTVIELNQPELFTVLAPGQSIDVTHDLSEAYNFTTSGEGSYSIEPSNLFHYVDPLTKTAVPIYADIDSAHTASLTGKLAVARNSGLEKRIGYTSCSSTRQSQIATAATNAQTYANGAASYLSSHTATSTRYVTWFGTWTSARRSTVLTHYNNMAGKFSTYTYDCTCTDSGTYAYVYPDEWGYVYLCGAFWNAPATGTDSKAGTLVHESSHFTNVGSTQDYAYGQSAAKSLASSNPDRAVANADNHEYFAENTPAQS